MGSRPKLAVRTSERGLDSAAATVVALSNDFNVRVLRLEYCQLTMVGLDTARHTSVHSSGTRGSRPAYQSCLPHP